MDSIYSVYRDDCLYGHHLSAPILRCSNMRRRDSKKKLKCEVCKYEWYSRVDTPKECPECIRPDLVIPGQFKPISGYQAGDLASVDGSPRRAPRLPIRYRPSSDQSSEACVRFRWRAPRKSLRIFDRHTDPVADSTTTICGVTRSHSKPMNLRWISYKD